MHVTVLLREGRAGALGGVSGRAGAGPRPRFGHPPTACGYAGQLFATVGWSSLPYLWRLRTPTLVIAGDRDAIIPVVERGYSPASFPMHVCTWCTAAGTTL